MQTEQIADGQYTADITLSGGSGRATITSPAEITVQDGEVQAKIVWSSSNYDYMEVDGKSYSPVNETGNSTFLINDVPLDEEVPVLAETTAMNQPHMIEYSIYVHGDTLQSTDSSPALAIGLSCAGAALLCAAVIAATSVWVAKKRKKHHEANL